MEWPVSPASLPFPFPRSSCRLQGRTRSHTRRAGYLHPQHLQRYKVAFSDARFGAVVAHRGCSCARHQ